jgi:hypothetical protein
LALKDIQANGVESRARASSLRRPSKLVSLIAVDVVEKLESHAIRCDFDQRALISFFPRGRRRGKYALESCPRARARSSFQQLHFNKTN